MLFWQDGSFLGLETQIDPFSISGYMLALLAMLLQELRKNMLVGSAESKTKMQSVGSMLRQLSIVAHCIPRVYVIPIFGFAGTHFFNKKT